MYEVLIKSAAFALFKYYVKLNKFFQVEIFYKTIYENSLLLNQFVYFVSCWQIV